MPAFVTLTEECNGKLQFYEEPNFDSKYDELSFEVGVSILALRSEGCWFYCRTPDVSGYVYGLDIQPASYPSIGIINNELPDNAQIRVRKQPMDADDNVLLILSPRAIVYISGVEADGWIRLNINNTTAYMKRYVGDTPLVLPVVPTLYRKNPSLPVGCSLRIRGAPSEDAPVVGMFTSDLILVAQRSGNWLQVVQEMTSAEWMMCASNDGVCLLELQPSAPTLMALAMHLPAEASIRVRREPFMDADLVGTVGTEQVIPVSGISDGWARVVCLGLNGYMLATSNSMALLEPLPDQSAPPAINDRSPSLPEISVPPPSPALALSPAIMMKKQSPVSTPQTPSVNVASPRDLRRSLSHSDSKQPAVAETSTPEQHIKRGSSFSSKSSPVVSSPASPPINTTAVINDFDDMPLPAQSKSSAQKAPLPPTLQSPKPALSGPLVHIMELLGSYEFAEQVKGLEEMAELVEQVHSDEGGEAAARLLLALADDLCSCLQDNNNIVLDTALKTLMRLMHLDLPLATDMPTTADASSIDASTKKLTFPARVTDMIIAKLFYGRTPDIVNHATNAVRKMLKNYPSTVSPILRKSMQARNLHTMLQALYCVSAAIGEEMSEPNALAHDVIIELLKVIPQAKPKHRTVALRALQRALTTWPDETRQWIENADEDLLTEHITSLLRRTKDTPSVNTPAAKTSHSPDEKPLIPKVSPVVSEIKHAAPTASDVDERPVAAALHTVDPEVTLSVVSAAEDDRNSSDPIKRIKFLMTSFNQQDQLAGIASFVSHLQLVQKKEGNDVAAEHYAALADGLCCCLQDASNDILEPAVTALLGVQGSRIPLDRQAALTESEEDAGNRPQHVSVLVDILTTKLFHGKSTDVIVKAQEIARLLVQDYAGMSIVPFAKALTSRNLYISLASLQCLSTMIGTEIVCPDEEHILLIVDALLQVIATSKPKHRNLALKCISQLLYISKERTTNAIMSADDARRPAQVMELLNKADSGETPTSSAATSKKQTAPQEALPKTRKSSPTNKKEQIISDHYPLPEQVEYSLEDVVKTSPSCIAAGLDTVDKRESPTIRKEYVISALSSASKKSPPITEKQEQVKLTSDTACHVVSESPQSSPRFGSPVLPLSRVPSLGSMPSNDTLMDLLSVGDVAPIMEYKATTQLETGCRHDMKRLTDPATMMFTSANNARSRSIWNKVRFGYDDDNSFMEILHTELMKRSSPMMTSLLSHDWNTSLKFEKFEPFDVEKLRQSKSICHGFD